MPSCCNKSNFRRLELVFGILFGLWNNLTTILNAQTLSEKNHLLFSFLTIFFLLFPGLVTSVGFLVLHYVGHRKIGKLPPGKVIAGFLVLLCFYPVVPIVLCIVSLVTGRHFQLTYLAKFFEGFLDDGPQFVLRLIVVVLYGIGLASEDFDAVFKLSMATSFLALVFFGLKFNERDAPCATKLLLCLPMFAAFAVARAFLLAVFLKETLGNPKEQFGALAVLVLFCFINIGSYKLCGQDIIRSVVFGLCSILIPAGYGNDSLYYQCPNQPLSQAVQQTIDEVEEEEDNPYVVPPTAPTDGQAGVEEEEEVQGERRRGLLARLGNAVPNRIVTQATKIQMELRSRNLNILPGSPPEIVPVGGDDAVVPVVTELHKMRSGLFLVLYTISNAVLLLSCAIYVSTTRDLSTTSDEALMLPLILAVIPGCFFALARAILLDDLRPRGLSIKIWNPIKFTMSALCGIVAYSSLVPAAFWGALYKFVGRTSAGTPPV